MRNSGGICCKTACSRDTECNQSQAAQGTTCPSAMRRRVACRRSQHRARHSTRPKNISPGSRRVVILRCCGEPGTTAGPLGVTCKGGQACAVLESGRETSIERRVRSTTKQAGAALPYRKSTERERERTKRTDQAKRCRVYRRGGRSQPRGIMFEMAQRVGVVRLIFTFRPHPPETATYKIYP